MNYQVPEEWCPSGGIQLDSDSLDVVHSQVSQAIQAGPGAGKTELLAQRAAFLLQTNTCTNPRKILAISFKRDAAKNLKERVSVRVGPDLSKRFDSYTFDAFAKGILDRFREGLPQWVRPDRTYEILGSVEWRIWNDFGNRPNLMPPFERSNFNWETVKNFHAYFGSSPMPFPTSKPIATTPVEALTLAWWDNQLSRRPQMLTFDMVKTLAHTIIRHNPLIKQAFVKTYSHVFLDEFQDTTLPQYALLKEIFEDSNATLTAVGDNKQLIMTFAGATNRRFAQFVTDFNASDVALASNFRSNQRIVDIVNSLAKSIEPNAVTVKCSSTSSVVPPAVTDGVIHFADDDSERIAVADFISREIANTELKPRDFMILVRQKADDHENDGLKSALKGKGLTLRNEARTIGKSGVSLQDLSSEPLSQAIILFLQVATGDRRYRAYPELIDLMTESHASMGERSAEQFELEQTLRRACNAFTGSLSKPADQFSWDGLVNSIVSELGEDKLRRLAQEYKNAARFQKIKTGIAEFLLECSTGAKGWSEIIDNYLGVDQVRLMTVHKSKGLEAHTIIFFSLVDKSFFHKAKIEEEKLAFFVALSRAKQRIFVTKGRGAVSRIQPLYDLLQSANVPVLPSFP